MQVKDNKLTVKILHFTDNSAVSVYSAGEHFGWIIYTSKIHKYLSESDFKSLHAENVTYGTNATLELFDYLKDSRGRA